MRALRLIEKLNTSFFLNSSKPIYFTMNSKNIVTSMIYHNEKKDNFIVATFKVKGSNINGNIVKHYKQGNDKILIYYGLSPVGKPIIDDKVIASTIIKEAKRLGLIKKYYGILDKKAFITTMTSKEVVVISTLKNMFPEVDFTVEGEKLGDLNILGEKPKQIENAKALLKEVTKVYKSIKMDKVMYGDIYLTNAMGGGKLADYNGTQDNIRLSSSSRKSSHSIHDAVHEFAHRWYAKFLSDSQKKEIQAKYDETMGEIANKTSLAIGDEYDHPKYGPIVIESKDFNKRTYDSYYVFRVEKDNSRYRIKDAGNLRKATKTKGDKDVFTAFDTTNYGRTCATEFWPEVVATALTKKDKTLLEWIKGFTK